MAIGTDTITIYRGAASELNFTMSPLTDISGWTIELAVEGSPKSPKMIEKTATIISGPLGTFKFVLLAGDTADLYPGRYQYDVWRVDSGSEIPIAVGTFVISDVARLPA